VAENDGIMAISDKRLSEFIAIYEAVFGESLTPDEARPIADRLVTVYRLLTRPPNEPAG